jgi:hypothetical protein
MPTDEEPTLFCVIDFDRYDWKMFGNDPSLYDEYRREFYEMRARNDILHRLCVIKFDAKKYRNWLGDRQDSDDMRLEWASYEALNAAPKTPEQLVADYDRLYPRIKEHAEGFWLYGRKNIHPTEYLPLDLWPSVFNKEGYIESENIHVNDVFAYGALAAWRYGKHVYKFDPTLAEALIATPANELQGEALSRLSSWCVYVECPASMGIFGFFAMNIHNYDDNSQRLQLFYHSRLQRLILAPTLTLTGKTIEEGLSMIKQSLKETVSPEDAEGARKELEFLTGKDNKRIAACLSLLLYIHSEAPDIEGHIPNASPYYPSPKKTKRGLKLFEADRRRVIYAGRTIGEKIRAAIESDRIAHTSGRTVRPHIRRAHWHGYWRGKKDGERTYGHKWLFPIVVNIAD